MLRDYKYFVPHACKCPALPNAGLLALNGSYCPAPGAVTAAACAR